MYYRVTLHAKNNVCILKSDINLIGFFCSKNNLTKYDVKKLKIRSKKLKSSFISIDKMQSRFEWIKMLKNIYPGYNFRQLKEIGFNL